MSIEQIRRSVLIVVAAGAIAVAGLFAGRLSANAIGPHGSRGDFATRVFTRISSSLDLSDDQVGKVKDVLRNHAPEIRAQLQAAASAREALHAAMIAQPLDENGVRTAAQQVGETQANGALLFAKIRAEVDPILTAEQKSRIQSFQGKMGQRADKAVQSFDAFLKSNP
ncbi:MAG TPA: periplasmic heavy metal sensor [Thermoanaerobaculia bacterium]